MDRERGNGKKGLRAALLLTTLCLGLSAVATVPFFLVSRSPSANVSRLWMPLTNDMILHLDQMKSFYRGLAAGEVYPRWEEDTNRAFGAPTTSYYPPGVYYITSALFAVTGDWIWTLLLAQLLMMAASAAAIFLYARRHVSRGAAIAAMIAYVFLPYHMLDQYQRGAIAELLSFAFMPLMLLFAERLMEDGETKSSNEIVRRRVLNSGGLALTVGAFLWCHPPTAYQFMIAFGLFVILFAWLNHAWRRLSYIAIAIAAGLALSAAYLYPAFVEQNLIRHEFITNTWPYRDSYVFARGTGYDMIDFTWIFNVFAIAVGGLTLLAVERRFVAPVPGLRQRVWLWVIVGGFASFMMLQVSDPFGRLIPMIDIGVFAWRMLSITTLVTALLAGACVQAALNASRQRSGRSSNSIASMASVVIVGGALFGAIRVVAPTFGAPPFETAEEHVNLAMMPATAPVEALELPRVERAELADGRGRVDVRIWEPEHRELSVELSAPDKLLIRTFNFPGWRALVDGEPAQITNGEALRVDLGGGEKALIRSATFRGGTPRVDGKPGEIVGTEPLGDIVIAVNAGNHRVTLDYEDTRPRSIGALVTLSAFALVIALMVVSLILNRGLARSARVS